MEPQLYILYISEKQKKIDCVKVYSFDENGRPLVVVNLDDGIKLEKYNNELLTFGIDRIISAYEFELASLLLSKHDSYRFVFNGKTEFLYNLANVP